MQTLPIGDVGDVACCRHTPYKTRQDISLTDYDRMGRVGDSQDDQALADPDVGVVVLDSNGEGGTANLAYELHVFGVDRRHAQPSWGRQQPAAAPRHLKAGARALV